MTIEEEFYRTFGIEKTCLPQICSNYIGDCGSCKALINGKRTCLEYPEITDRVILELICILSNNNCCRADIIGWIIYEDLREIILRRIIRYKDEIKSQVQALFEEQDENTQD